MHDGFYADTSLAGRAFQPLVGNKDPDPKDGLHAIGRKSLGTLGSSVTFSTFAGLYFLPVSCFLLFNVFDWTGRSLTALFTWVNVGQGANAQALLIPRPLSNGCHWGCHPWLGGRRCRADSCTGLES